MLKSHFNLARNEEENEHFEEEHPGEHGEHGGEAITEEEKKVYPVMKLSKSVISVHLSFLGKTADGDG